MSAPERRRRDGRRGGRKRHAQQRVRDGQRRAAHAAAGLRQHAGHRTMHSVIERRARVAHERRVAGGLVLLRKRALLRHWSGQ